MSRIISVLPGIVRFASGVGDNDDLVVRVRQDVAGAWFPVIHKGTYYIGTEERYLFSSGGVYNFSVTTTSGAPTATGSVIITGLPHDPTRRGPVLLSYDFCPRPMKRVCSPLRAFRAVSLTASTGQYSYFTVPNSGILVSLVSHPTTGILLSVPSSGDIRTTEQYWYDFKNGKVWVRGASFPSLYATYLVGELDQDLIKQEEILMVDRDGLLRTQYKNVLMNPAPPLIRKPTPTGTISERAIDASGNVVTPPASGGFASGDIVAIEYYVQNSYTAVPSGEHILKIDYVLTLSGSYTLEYETGDIWYDVSLLPSGSTNYIQLNPLITQRESGFLYISDVDAPYPPPTRLAVDLSNSNPWRTTEGWEVNDIAITVLDAEGQAIPQQRVVTTVLAGSGNLITAFPSDQKTNGRGQVVYVWSPTTTGLVKILAYVSGAVTVSGIVSFFVRDVGFYTQQSELRLGKLLLNIEETPFLDDLFRVSAYYCYPDGAPFVEADRQESTTYLVTFNCQKSQFYTLSGQPLPKNTPLGTNEDGVASLLVKPIPGDTIRAWVQTPTSGRIRYSAPVVIPEENS